MESQRREYMERVGLVTYLSQMLGSIATTPVGECVLRWADGRERSDFREQKNRPVQRWIRAMCDGDLPLSVEAGDEVRFL